MKTFNLVMFTLVTNLIFSQNQDLKYRLSSEELIKIRKINEEVANKISLTQHYLEINWREINERKGDNLIIPQIITLNESINSLSEKDKKKILLIACIDCYEKEYLSQVKILEGKKIEKKRISDSVSVVQEEYYRIEKEKKIKEESLKKIRTDSINKINSSNKDKPYDLLTRNLSVFSKDINFTIFRNIDYNYSYSKFTSFLQTQMSLAEKQPIFTDTKITHKYIPKVSSGKEYLNVEYVVKKYNKIIGYYDFLEDVFIIEKVIIKGSPDLIVDLFIEYWNSGIKLENRIGTGGIVATKNILSDYIILKNINGKLEIEITKGNIDVNYKTTYGINKEK